MLYTLNYVKNIGKYLESIAKHLGQFVLRMDCCILVNLVLLRHPNNSISINALTLCPFASLSVNSQYLKRENCKNKTDV